MHTISKALAGAATLALVGIGVPAALADTAVGPDALLVDTAPLAPVALTTGQRTPGAYGLDVDGDNSADAFGYSLEPDTKPNAGVLARTQTLAAYNSTSRTFTDGGRLRWVATHGFGAVDPRTLAQRAGIGVDLHPGSTDYAMMQTATQAAIWRYATGVRVSSGYLFGATSTEHTKFWRVYNYLVNSAYSVSPKVMVYDEQPGQTQTQAVVVVTPASQIPTPTTPVTGEPAPAPTATTAPTSTTAPAPTSAPTATQTTTVAPTSTPTGTTAPVTTWTPGPDALRVSLSGGYRITMSNNAFSPSYGGFDITGDRQADVYGYCIEPNQDTSAGVTAWTQKFGAYDSATRTDWQDGGKVRWVASHGYGAVPGQELASTVGISVDLTAGSTDITMFQSATQAAIWRYTSGLVVNPMWRFGYTSADNTKFWKVYNYLVQNAVPTDAKATVYDEKAGEPKTQGFIIVTPPKPAPTPTPEPTKTPCPDDCPTPTPEPTKTPCPDDCPTPTPEPTKAL